MRAVAQVGKVRNAIVYEVRRSGRGKNSAA
jgi:hypothetical protein